jgi:hypothetical protein
MLLLAANILSGLLLALWAGLLMIGMMLIQGVADRQIPGAPNAGQIWFSIGVPATLFILLILALFIFNFVRRSPRLMALSAIIATLFFFRYVCMLAVIAAI